MFATKILRRVVNLDNLLSNIEKDIGQNNAVTRSMGELQKALVFEFLKANGIKLAPPELTFEEKDKLKLVRDGDYRFNKIAVIKMIRNRLNLSLIDAKHAVDDACADFDRRGIFVNVQN